MNKRFVEQLDLSGKLVAVRVDFNVPLKDGVVQDDQRIRAALPTIRHLQQAGARTFLMSHLGRPKGEAKDELRLAPIAKHLSELLNQEVKYARDCIGDDAKQTIANLQNGEVALLENVRFHAEEEKNDAEFAKQLAHGADCYVNDAFGAAHRAHASTEGITKHVAHCACGFIIRDELAYLGKALANPEHPYVAISGGAKISGKIDLVQNLLPKVDRMLIGGGMTFTFLKAQGFEIGKSLLEEDKVDLARETLAKAGDKLVLPVDFLVSPEFDFKAGKIGELSAAPANGIPADCYGLDIGAQATQQFRSILLEAKTIIWNGPMGVFEFDQTADGTFAVARALAEATKNGATTIVGGGDSAAAIQKAGLADQVSHVSTGGGATLEFLEGRELPGVAALDDA